MELEGKGYEGFSDAVPNARIAKWRPPLPPPDGLGERLLLIRWDAVLICLGVGALWLSFGLLMFMSHAHFSGFINVAIIFTVLGFAKMRQRSASRRITSLLDIPPTLPQYPVRIELFEKNRKYAVDYGIATFVGGVMHYQGLSTEFDVPLLGSNPKVPKKNAYSTRSHDVQFQWYGERSTIQLRVTPQEGIPGSEPKVVDRFHVAFSDWKNLPFETNGCSWGQRGRMPTPPPVEANGLTIYPPIDPQPSFVLRSLRWAVVFEFVALALTAGLCVFAERTLQFSDSPTPRLSACCFVLCVFWLATICVAFDARSLEANGDALVGFSQNLSCGKLRRTGMAIFRPRSWWVPFRDAFRKVESSGEETWKAPAQPTESRIVPPHIEQQNA